MNAKESVAELRSSVLPTDAPLYLQGYYAPGDGGEGMFYYDDGTHPGVAASIAAGDDGGLAFVDVAGNRWVRQIGGDPVSVLWFGAYPDNTHPSETTAAIQQAINAAQALFGGGTVWLPAGAYQVNATLVLTANITLVGAGNYTIAGATRINFTSRSWDWISIQLVNFGVRIRGIALCAATSATGVGGAAIRIYCSQKVTIEDSYITGCWNGILNDSSGAVELRRLEIDFCDAAPSGAYRFGVKCTAHTNLTSNPKIGNPNSMYCDSIWITQPDSNNRRTAHGFVLTEGYQSLTLNNCTTKLCQYGRWMISGGAAAPNYLVEEGGTAEGCDTGWALDAGDPISTTQLSNCFCLSSSRNNFYVHVTHNGDVQFSSCRVSNSGGQTAGAGAGFSLNGTGNYVLSGCVVNHSGGHNVAISNSASVSIAGGSFSWPMGATDQDSIHIYSSASGTLCLGGVNQHNASRGIFDDGSTCLIWGSALFRTNSITNYDLDLNHSSPASHVSHP